MARYIVKRLEEVREDELCSVDPDYTLAEVSQLCLAHSQGIIDLEKEVWFGYKENYVCAPRSAIAIVKVVDDE